MQYFEPLKNWTIWFINIFTIESSVYEFIFLMKLNEILLLFSQMNKKNFPLFKL